jgi:hypothetical protein
MEVKTQSGFVGRAFRLTPKLGTLRSYLRSSALLLILIGTLLPLAAIPVAIIASSYEPDIEKLSYVEQKKLNYRCADPLEDDTCTYDMFYKRLYWSVTGVGGALFLLGAAAVLTYSASEIASSRKASDGGGKEKRNWKVAAIGTCLWLVVGLIEWYVFALMGLLLLPAGLGFLALETYWGYQYLTCPRPEKSKRPQYEKCRSCDFWVSLTDGHCPDCGVTDPRTARSVSTDKGRTDDVLSQLLSIGVGGWGFIGTFFITPFLFQDKGIEGVSGIFFFCFVICPLVGYYLSKLPLFILKFYRGGGHIYLSLRQMERTIKSRLDEFRRRAERVATLRRQATAEGAEEWRRVREVLDAAHEALIRQRARYDLKLHEIEVVRWQNRLVPVTADWDDMTYQDSERRLNQLRRVQEDGEAMLFALNQFAWSDAHGATDRVSETLTACLHIQQALTKKREMLLMNEAVLAVRGISPIGEELNPIPPPTEALREIDLFNIRAGLNDFSYETTLSDFSTSFVQLELEYDRLRREEEVAQQVRTSFC